MLLASNSTYESSEGVAAVNSEVDLFVMVRSYPFLPSIVAGVIMVSVWDSLPISPPMIARHESLQYGAPLEVCAFNEGEGFYRVEGPWYLGSPRAPLEVK